MQQVEFPRVDGLIVDATANPVDQPWTCIWPNQAYTFSFPLLNAGEAYSGTGVLRVTFPRRGTYPIRLRITARDFRPVSVTLPVTLR